MLGERLFYPHPALPGILKCGKCEALFITAAHILSLKKVEPTLEDVFVGLVGRTLAEDEEDAEVPEEVPA